MTSENKPSNSSGKMISDLMIDPDVDHKAAAGLIDEPESSDPDNFESQLERTLLETEEAALNVPTVSAPGGIGKWKKAKDLVTQFKPIPWFIWRLSNHVLGQPGHTREVSEGIVLGLRRLLFAAASDSTLGAGKKVNTIREALKILTADEIAAISVIHAICRRLSHRPHQRIWRPILDDALLRARIGYKLTKRCENFGAGRGMLAGFSGRSGLAVLISSGELEQARMALEHLANSEPVSIVGDKVFGCDPLLISGLLMSASGCGRDSLSGILTYGTDNPLAAINSDEALKWLAAYALTDGIRMDYPCDHEREYCTALGVDKAFLEELTEDVKLAIRKGHGWNWLI